MINRKNSINTQFLYELIINSSDDAIISETLDGFITSFNPAAEILFGYTAAEAINKHISIIVPQNKLNEESDIASKIKDGEYIKNFLTERMGKDGSVISVSLASSPIKSNTGQIIGLSTIARNITDEMAAEKKLEQSIKEVADYKFALIESSIIGITDNKGVILFANDNLCKISKYSVDELIGQDHRIVNSGHHPKDYIQNLWTTIANGDIWRGELKNKAKDGSFYWVNTTIVPFLNGQGKPYQYVAIKDDITERKRVEEELLQLNLDLDEKVIERTEQLQLANKELDAFSYSVSHDLRAPLRAVNGYSKILLEDYGIQLDAEANRVINNIEANVIKMGQLIDDLLAFSRLGRKELILANIQMYDLVRGICNEMKVEYPKRNIEFHIHPIQTVLADMPSIKQVWINLISNAVKYTSPKEITIIEIGCNVTDHDIVYYVKDNGVGFDMQYADKLFGVFQRLHSDKEFEGTGVGLAIVHRIITKHNGKIWAESKLNEGTIFYFSLKKVQNEK